MPSRTTPQNGLLASHLTAAFRRTFARQDVAKGLRSLLSALREGHPILPLLGSFPAPLPSLFVPFHGGAVLPLNIRGMVARNELHPRLAEFCRACGTLELLTGKLPLRTIELTDRERVTLQKVLEHFLSILPTEEVFRSWLADDQ